MIASNSEYTLEFSSSQLGASYNVHLRTRLAFHIGLETYVDAGETPWGNYIFVALGMGPLSITYHWSTP